MTNNITSRFVEVDNVEELLQQDNAVKILDVRTPAEYESVHIPGSYNVPLDQLPEHRFELASKLRTPIVLVCRSGGRAEQAARIFEQTTLENFSVLRGGMDAWEHAGKSVKRGTQRWSMERQVRGLAGSLVFLSALGGLFVWQPLTYLALAIGGGLTYSALADSCGMAWILSKLPYNSQVANCDVRTTVKQLLVPDRDPQHA